MDAEPGLYANPAWARGGGGNGSRGSGRIVPPPPLPPLPPPPPKPAVVSQPTSHSGQPMAPPRPLRRAQTVRLGAAHNSPDSAGSKPAEAPTAGGALTFSWSRSSKRPANTLGPTVVVRHIELHSIDEPQIRRIVQARCGHPMPDTVLQALGERSGGNP
eukprot:1218401-Prymnesium_polylepis.1